MDKLHIITAAKDNYLALMLGDKVLYYTNGIQTIDNLRNNMVPFLNELFGDIVVDKVDSDAFQHLTACKPSVSNYFIDPAPMFDFNIHFDKERELVSSKLWASTITKAKEILDELKNSYSGLQEILKVLDADIHLKETKTGFNLYLTSALDSALINEAYHAPIHRYGSSVVPFIAKHERSLTDYFIKASAVIGGIGEYIKNKATEVSGAQSINDINHVNTKLRELRSNKTNEDLLFYDLIPYLDYFNRAYPTVDKDERGEFSFHLTRFGKCIAEYDTQDIIELTDDGYMDFPKDYVGLSAATGIAILPNDEAYYTRISKLSELNSVTSAEKFEQFMIDHITKYLASHPEILPNTTTRNKPSH